MLSLGGRLGNGIEIVRLYEWSSVWLLRVFVMVIGVLLMWLVMD